MLMFPHDENYYLKYDYTNTHKCLIIVNNNKNRGIEVTSDLIKCFVCFSFSHISH